MTIPWIIYWCLSSMVYGVIIGMFVSGDWTDDESWAYLVGGLMVIILVASLLYAGGFGAQNG